MGEIRQFPITKAVPVPESADELDRRIHVAIDLLLDRGLVEFPGDGSETFRLTPLGWRLAPVILSLTLGYLEQLPDWDERDNNSFMLVQSGLNEVAKILG